MKKVLFLIHQDKITTRRYLLIAQEFYKLKVGSVFLDLTNKLNRKKIKKQYKDLKLTYFPECIHLEKIITKLSLIDTKSSGDVNPSFKYNSLESFNNKPNDLEKLLKQLQFNSSTIIEEYYKKNIDRWDNKVNLYERILNKISPFYIFYDLEIIPDIRIFLLAVLRQKINTVSMQHTEGWGDQYSSLPRFADYYIAYSTYNVEKIKKLGIKDENIYLTGTPDTDIVFNLKTAQIKKELYKKYVLNFDKKIILLALKPSYQYYLSKNIDLVNIAYDIFGNDERFYILIKQHPVDIKVNLDITYLDGFLLNKKKKFISGDYPISKLFKITDYFITHISSCIVESILLDVKTIVVELEERAIWPDWESYGIYVKLPFIKLGETLTAIKNNEYSHNYSNTAREEFIKRFRFKYDNKAAYRIAKALNQ